MNKTRVFLVLVISLYFNFGLLAQASGSTSYTLKLTVIENAFEGKDDFWAAPDDRDQRFYPNNFNKENGLKKCTGWRKIWNASIQKYVDPKITKGTKLKIFNGSKKVLKLASLQKIDWIPYGEPWQVIEIDPITGKQTFDGTYEIPVFEVEGTCTFSVSIKLPKSNLYSIQLSGVEGSSLVYDFSFKELTKKKWAITLRF